MLQQIINLHLMKVQKLLNFCKTEHQILKKPFDWGFFLRKTSYNSRQLQHFIEMIALWCHI